MRGIPLPTARSLGLVDPDNNLLIDKLIPRLIAADDDQAVPALGELSAIVDSVSAPTAIYGLTYGDGATVRGVPVGALNSSTTVFVGANGTPSQNGTALLAAYDRAKALTPNGAALAADNRAAVIIGPGVYDLGSGSLTLDTEFVDLIGLDRDDVVITSSDNTVAQSADDVMIRDVTLISTSSTESAYTTGLTPLPNCKMYRVRCVNDDGGFSMDPISSYAGLYVQVVAGDYAFGSFAGLGGFATGTFIDCEAGDHSFGGSNGIAYGKFYRCKAGNNSFGKNGDQIGQIGIFVDCEAGSQSFCYNQPAGGAYIRCRAGNESFGSGNSASGFFWMCYAGTNSFGGNGGTVGSSARLFYCMGGSGSFGAKQTGAKTLFCVVGDAQYSGND